MKRRRGQIRPGVRRLPWLGQRSVDEEIDQEIGLHFELRVEQLMRDGLTRDAAEAEARSRFGPAETAYRDLRREAADRERARRFSRLLDTVRQDAAVALRAFGRNPGFTITAVLTLALGMGASSAIFSLVNAALLARFPFRDADRIAVVIGVWGPERAQRGASYPEAMDWRAGTRTIEQLTPYDETTLNLSGQGGARQLQAEIVSAAYFDLVGVAPARGRALIAEDDRPGVGPVAVISDALWRTRFGGDPGIVGRQITVDARATTIVGVMPPGFRGISFDTEIWTPLLPFDAASATERGSRWLMTMGRLRAGTSLEAAQADFDALTERLEREFPEHNNQRRADVLSLKSYYLDSTRTLLKVLFASVGFLLLIACANVTNLQLVRGMARGRELAVRTALGASRGRIVRQLLTESFVLAALGGLAGLAVAYWGLHALLPLIPDGVLPAYFTARVDARVILFTCGLVVLTALTAGLAPALRASRGALPAELRTQRATMTGKSARLQQSIVALEMALALTLLASAGLMIRSLQAQLHIDPGFRADRLFITRVSLPQLGEYEERAGRLRFAEALLRALPVHTGARDFALTLSAPLRGYGSAAIIEAADRPNSGIRYYRHPVTPGYFTTLGITILKGRGIERSDTEDAPRVVVVTERFVARMWPGQQDPTGRRLRLGAPDGPAVTVVGVVRDVRQRSLTASRDAANEDPDVYFSFAQFPPLNFDIVVREAQAGTITPQMIQRAVTAADPTIPIFHVQTLASSLAEQTASARFGSFVLGVFALLALTLGAVGLYGVTMFIVSARRRDMAIRLALGAEPHRMVREVVQNGMIVAFIGAAIGIVGAIAGTRVLGSFLYGVTPTDPFTLVVVSLLLIGTAAIANLVPALRAARIDPQTALRAD